MSSDTLEEVIQTLNDFKTAEYYSIAMIALLFHDYLLTFGDEVKYIWSGKKSAVR